MKKILCLLFCTILLCFNAFSQSIGESSKPRMRVIIDNDFSGDPDGLFHLAHQILSPSTEIRGIIGSFMRGLFGLPTSATDAVNKTNELLKVMNLSGKYQVYEGANTALTDLKTPVITEGAKAIVAEAMREDTKTPLYVLCGAGLTDIASAYLLEPKIAKRLTLIWIGGSEYSDLAIPPPSYSSMEYNLGIDVKAGQVIFNHSDIPLWQIPRDAYRQALVSYSQLSLNVETKGKTGEFLVNELKNLISKTKISAETYILGDSPLILLTGLQSFFEADASSSTYVLKPAPQINSLGLYETNHSGRNIRVYTHLDTYLMFDDFYSKLELLSRKK